MKKSKKTLAKTIKTNSLLLITFLLMASCQLTQKKTNNSQNNNTLHKKWMLVQLDSIDKETLVKHKVHIDLSKKTAGSAYAGCNNIQFQYNTTSSSISFSDIVATRMYCENTSNIEQLLLKGLESTKLYKVENQSLLLITKSNDTIKCVAEDWD